MTDDSGPTRVTAPSMSEVMSIVERRRRHRQRWAVGTATVAVAAGFTFAAVRAGADDPESAELEPVSSPSLDDRVTTTTITIGECDPFARTDAVEQLLTTGRERYFSVEPITYDEAVSLADEWVVSTDEIKALAGLAHQVGVTLDATVFADAQRAWVGGDVAEPDLESIADEWELEPSSLKVIAMLDVPGTAALLDPCTSVDD